MWQFLSSVGKGWTLKDYLLKTNPVTMAGSYLYDYLIDDKDLVADVQEISRDFGIDLGYEPEPDYEEPEEEYYEPEYEEEIYDE